MEDFTPKPPVNISQSIPEEAPAAGEILAGEEGKDLAESMHTYTLENGDMVFAGTDKGIGYKDHNEDRVVVSPSQNFVAVVDGMGGMGHGDVAAQILAEEVAASPRDIVSASSKAIDKMLARNILRGGAVFASARVVAELDGKFLEAFQLGDSSMLVIDINKNIIFESEDDSVTARLAKEGVITPDQALYSGMRHMVSSAVSPNEDVETRVPKSYPRIKVEKGSKVILMSDGVSNNLTMEDIAKKVKAGLTKEELFAWISKETSRRMLNHKQIIESSDRPKDGVYSDGYKSKPKPDNRALVIVEIK